MGSIVSSKLPADRVDAQVETKEAAEESGQGYKRPLDAVSAGGQLDDDEADGKESHPALSISSELLMSLPSSPYSGECTPPVLFPSLSLYLS